MVEKNKDVLYGVLFLDDANHVRNPTSRKKLEARIDFIYDFVVWKYLLGWISFSYGLPSVRLCIIILRHRVQCI